MQWRSATTGSFRLSAHVERVPISIDGASHSPRALRPGMPNARNSAAPAARASATRASLHGVGDRAVDDARVDALAIEQVLGVDAADRARRAVVDAALERQAGAQVALDRLALHFLAARAEHRARGLRWR